MKYSFLIIFHIFFSWQLVRAEVIKHAVGVHFPPHGLTYFENHLYELLNKNGLNLDDIFLYHHEVVMEEKETEEFVSDPEVQAQISATKSYLKKFLGIEILPHKLELQMRGIQWTAKWNKISLMIDPPVVHVLSEGVVESEITARIELSLRDARIYVNKLSLIDRANSFDNGAQESETRFGANEFTIYQTSDSPPLEISVPLTIRKMDRHFYVEFGDITSSFKEMGLGFGFDGPIEVPNFKIVVGQKEFGLELGEVEQLIFDNGDLIKESFKEKVAEAFSTELPILMTQKINELVQVGFSEISRMTPPGAPEDKPVVPSFYWQLQLEDIDYRGRYFHMGLNAHMNDPLAEEKTRIKEGLVSFEVPELFEEEQSPHDVIFSINKGLFNRALQLSFERGYFDQTSAGEEKISLGKQPTFYFAKTRDKSSGYVHKPGSLTLVVKQKAHGLEKLFLKSSFQVQFDILVDFEVDSSGQINMVARGVDLDSVYVADKYIRMFPGTVRDKVKEALAEKTESVPGMMWEGVIPLGEEVAGIPIRLESVRLDKSGHLLVFATYRSQ